jgi:hypothetical protein
MVSSLTRRAFLALGGVGLVGAALGLAALRWQGTATGATTPSGTASPAASPLPTSRVTLLGPAPTATTGPLPPTPDPNADIRAAMLAMQAKIDGRARPFTLLIPRDLARFRFGGVHESGTQAPTVDLYLGDRSNEKRFLKLLQSAEAANGIDTVAPFQNSMRLEDVTVRGVTGRLNVAPRDANTEMVQVVWMHGDLLYSLFALNYPVEEVLQIADTLVPLR